MSVEYTPEGQRAYDVVQQVFGKQLGAQAAWQEIGTLSQEATGKAAIEIGDAATMLLRLAGPPAPPARSIADQVMGT